MWRLGGSNPRQKPIDVTTSFHWQVDSWALIDHDDLKRSITAFKLKIMIKRHTSSTSG